MSFVGSIILGIINLVKRIVKPFISLGVGTSIIALGLLWAALVLCYFLFMPFASYMGPSPGILSFLGSTAALAVAGIPVFMLMMWLTRWFSDYKIPAHIKKPLRIGWFASLLISGFMIFEIASDHADMVELKSTDAISISDNKLHIGAIDQPSQKSFKVVRFFHTQYSKKGLLNDDVNVHLRKGTGDKVTIEKVLSANGSTEQKASQRAEAIDADIEFADNTINIPKYFFVNKKQKYRNQRVDYFIHIPEGMEVSMDKSISGYVHHSGGFENSCRCNLSEYNWTMGEEGLYSDEWNAEYKATKEIDLAAVKNINIEGRFDVEVKQGKERKVYIKGKKKNFDHVEYIPTEDAVTLINSQKYGENLKMTIITPAVDILSAKNVKGLVLDGFTQDKMYVLYNSNGKLKIYADVNELTAEIIGHADGVFIGSGDVLAIRSRNAWIDAEKYKVKKTVVSGNVRNNSSIYASEEAIYDHDIQYRLTVFGDPTKSIAQTEEH